MITLNPREKRILTVGGCFVGALLVYLLVISPYLKAVELLERRIAQKAEELQEVQTLQEEYLGLREKVRMLEKMVRSTSGFSLLSFLENLAEKTDIKKQITYMKPVTSPTHEKYRESSVEIISSWSFSPGRIPISTRGAPGAIASARSVTRMLGMRGTYNSPPAMSSKHEITKSTASGNVIQNRVIRRSVMGRGEPSSASRRK